MKLPTSFAALIAGDMPSSFPRLSHLWHQFRRQLRWPDLPALRAPLADRANVMGLGVTLALMAVYAAVLLAYGIQNQRAFGTHAEDMGIMDQVLWNTTHGHFWHQTICNALSDDNCLGNISRWAIHFEPLMLLLVPLYALLPSPNTLIAVQVLGVAVGALPAYWLGSRRLGQPAGGVVLAGAYLLMPALRAGVTDDFHMVALAAPALMFAIYGMYAQDDRMLFVASLIALATKEQVGLDVFMLGLAVIVLQRRRIVGVKLCALAVGWTLLALLVLHLASPLGASPTAVRYGGFGGSLARLPQIVTDPVRRIYLTKLLKNTGLLGLAAPWMLVLALPSVLLNLLSAFPNQYSGGFQYNVDIAPFLLVAALEGGIAVSRFGGRLLRQLVQPIPGTIYEQSFLVMLLCVSYAVVVQPLPANLFALNPNTMDTAQADVWPQITAHTREAALFLRQIPATASLTAQSALVPHVSQREFIYQFPDNDEPSAYVWLDVTSDYYPEPDPAAYVAAVRATLASGRFTLVDAQDGYILLRADPTPSGQAIVLPPAFCPHTSPLLSAAQIQQIAPVCPG
jgi:uncharacterized membrane protein